jgi:hypothetical protein
MWVYLLLLTIVTLAVSVLSAQFDGWWGGFLSNLGAGFAGSLLTVGLVEVSIERSKRNEVRRIRRTAFARLKQPVVTHLQFLFNLHKATAGSAPAQGPREIQDIFTDEYFECVRHLNFNAKGPCLPEMRWQDFGRLQGETFRRELERVADIYMAYLDPHTVETIEALRDSSFMHILVTVWPPFPGNAEVHFRQMPNPLLINMEKAVRGHVASALALLALLNQNLEERLTAKDLSALWRNDVAPSIGSARAVLAFPGDLPT